MYCFVETLILCRQLRQHISKRSIHAVLHDLSTDQLAVAQAQASRQTQSLSARLLVKCAMHVHIRAIRVVTNSVRSWTFLGQWWPLSTGS